MVRRYLTDMRTTISTKGQIVLPAELREQDRILTGQQFNIERIEAGEYRLKKIALPENSGLVDWLLSCRECGWFRPIKSETLNPFDEP
jgi:AbrB family looped-hinge helix DNA binding protein